MFPATLFDYNGVLADDETIHLEAFRDLLAPLGIQISERDYVERYLGFDDRGAFQAILENSGQTASEARIAELIAQKMPLYRARAEKHLPVFAGAQNLLRARARVGPVAIVSGALREEIVLGLRVLGVEPSRFHIVSAEDTKACKPDPEGYLLGIEYMTGLIGPENARKSLVIEDSLAGVEAAKRAGLPCVAVTHSYSESTLLEAGADLAVARLDALSEERLAALYDELYG